MAKAKKKQTQADTHNEARARVVALLRRILDTKRWLSFNSVYAVVWWADESNVNWMIPPLCDHDPCSEQTEADALLSDLNMLSVEYRGGDLEDLKDLRARWFGASPSAPSTRPEPTLVLATRALRVLERERLDERERKALQAIRDSSGGELGVGEIALRIGVKEADTVRPVLDRLASLGLIARPNDRRPYSLTDTGRRAVE
jgi:hypothetical protein